MGRPRMRESAAPASRTLSRWFHRRIVSMIPSGFSSDLPTTRVVICAHGRACVGASERAFGASWRVRIVEGVPWSFGALDGVISLMIVDCFECVGCQVNVWRPIR